MKLEDNKNGGGPSSGDAMQRGLLHSADQKIEVVAVDRLVPHKANARTHRRKQVRKIADSMARFGFCNPILIDDHDQIIAGHGRVEAAKVLGLTAVPALRLSHLSGAEKRAYVLADNRLAELAGWDKEILAIELQGLRELNFEVELTGFDTSTIDVILNDADEARAESADGAADEIPERTVGPAVSQVGDVWMLGGHYLLCGDADDEGIDAAIRRWQNFTGGSATLAGTNKTFEEMEEERASSRAAPPLVNGKAP
jgi:ParB-like nuclease domain